MKARHGEEATSPLVPVSLQRLWRILTDETAETPGGGSCGEAETAYSEYGRFTHPEAADAFEEA